MSSSICECPTERHTTIAIVGNVGLAGISLFTGGETAALEANSSEAEELATFNAVGVYSAL